MKEEIVMEATTFKKLLAHIPDGYRLTFHLDLKELSMDFDDEMPMMVDETSKRAVFFMKKEKTSSRR
jgi:hypothetical protein